MYSFIYNSSFIFISGADIETRDSAHFTPLMVAVAEGHEDSVKILLKSNAIIDVLDNMDRSVIFWAAQENHPKTLSVCKSSVVKIRS